MKGGIEVAHISVIRQAAGMAGEAARRLRGGLVGPKPLAREVARTLEERRSSWLQVPSHGSISYTKGSIGILKSVKVVGYIRVSTGEQADSGLGLEAQRQAIRHACGARGWRLLGIHEDAGFSAKNMNRPALNEALRAVEAGKADALVVAKIDRLSRSLLDFAKLTERSRKNEWALVALDLGVDTTTPAGEMIANTIANFAQYERRMTGQRTKEALAVRRRQGVRLGRPPSMPPHVVRKMTRMRGAGASLRQIADRLTEEGVPTAQGGLRWYPATVRKTLLSRTDRKPTRNKAQR